MKSQLHEVQMKVRLTESDYELLDVLSRRKGIPKAALARSFIKRSLMGLSYESSSIQKSAMVGRGQ